MKFSLIFLCGHKLQILLGKKNEKKNKAESIMSHYTRTAAVKPQYEHRVLTHSQNSTAKWGKIQRQVTRITRGWNRFWSRIWENSTMKNGANEPAWEDGLLSLLLVNRVDLMSKVLGGQPEPGGG